ncbi:hypothetical protein F2Q70_00037978 [Brassica cretica]|uniref:AAA+ ATPase domain-containing protein n=1 Tax=Brassica cretica TaxID=69181 RepID=A0A8S9KD14_BRACR|nr:hypothetical protein F2Q70_00037978 [Brassica cretica]
MEFDIPLPEELELLEANYPEEEDDDYLNFEEAPYPYPIDGDEEKEEEEEEEEEESIAQKESNLQQSESPDINGCKRPRSLVSDPIVNLDEASEKRSKVNDNRVEMEDEEWLRFSPVKEAVQIMGEEEEVISQETVFSRYASEIDGECFPITAPDGGDRVYAKFSRALGDEEVKRFHLKAKSNGLIKDPISVLLQQSENESFNKALQTSSEDQNEAMTAETSVMHEKLWVDKYSPNSFTELLSDEQTNLEVLLWLKQWDASVFGSEIRSTTDEVLSALKRHSTPNSDVSNSNTTDNHDMRNKKSKLIAPPEQKILLLCGPPGLGKTTLAHVAAKHCGYRVVEINASDERSAAAIETRILDVVQMNSVTADSRPKCLVIDEIDGALGNGKGAVDVILKMVLEERKNATGKENIDNGKTSSKKERRTAPLSRPVIFICNDLYAPVFRPLRQIAKVHIFVQPTVSRVVNRLKYICNMEGMKTRSFGLSALADYTVVGRKDMSKSLFDIWKEIFNKRKMKRERSNDASGSDAKKFDFLHSLVSTRYLQYHDPAMDKTVSCLDCLGTSDLLHRYIMRTQQMSLYVYVPSLVIPIHRRVAHIQRPAIQWPKSYHRHLSIKSFVEDSVSPLLHILSPPTHRPVASHLLSERQKDQLASLVMLMHSYSLTYKTVKLDPALSNPRESAASDASVLALDPHLFDFISFKGRQIKHHVLTLAMKQVLVHEVEKQKILLQASEGRSGILSKPEIKKTNPDLVRKTIAASNESTWEDHHDTKSSRKDYEDPEDVQKRATAKRNSRPLLFKFNGGNVLMCILHLQGFTNAVKRPVRMREFLL